MAKDGAGRNKALSNPAAVYRSPEEVESDGALSREDKLAILKTWEEDARELSVAEQENMSGGEPSRLDLVAAVRLRIESAEAEANPAAVHVSDLVRPVKETVHADQEIDEAALRLSLQEIPILPVSDGDEIVGMLTQEHLAQAPEVAPGDARVTARVVMTSDLAFCYLDDDVQTARALMDRHDCDHLLVIDAEGGLVGMLGREDLPAMSAEQARSVQDGPDVVELREEVAGGVASKVQPGGLDVYADRPRIKLSRD